MTHGPPKYILDACLDGNVGCANLLHAARRAKPLPHCFGHIHEVNGARMVTWDKGKDLSNKREVEGMLRVVGNMYPESSRDWGVVRGRETLMVNAAIMDGENEPKNKPWVVDLELRRK